MASRAKRWRCSAARSILGALEGKFRRVPFRTTVSRETKTGTGGAWVAEGASTPVAATAYDTLGQEAYKSEVIVVLSNELLQLGNPAAERTVRQTTTTGVGAFLDAQLLTNTVTLVANTRPAAITNGATAVTSTGTTAAQTNADLAALLAAVTTPGPLAWIMLPKNGVSHCGDDRRDCRSPCAAHALRHSAGAQCQQSGPSDAARPVADFVFRQRRDRDRLDGTGGAADERQPDGSGGGGDSVQSLWQNNLWAVKVTR